MCAQNYRVNFFDYFENILFFDDFQEVVLFTRYRSGKFFDEITAH